MLGSGTGGQAAGRTERNRRTVVDRLMHSVVPATAAFSGRSALSALRRIAGMPDYEGHVEHLKRCHPGEPVPTEREFFDHYVSTRYGGGPTRCC
jgi:uncharacterized short protein YbdD (DUF466 family)